MPDDEAKYHMKRCVDSGLWLADARAADHGLIEEKVLVNGSAADDLDLD